MQFHDRIGLLIATTLLLGLSPALAGDRALLIGINSYSDPSFSPLSGPVLDVQHMRDMLISDLGYEPNEIMTLTESRATRQGILDAIRSWLIAGTAEGDRVFLYFSGHGVEVAIPDGSGSTRLTSGLVPIDSNINKVNPASPTVGGLVLGSHLRELFLEMKGRTVTAVADSCQSGSITRGPRPSTPPGVKTISPNGPINLRPEDMSDEIIVQNKADASAQLFDFVSKGGDELAHVAAWSAVTLAQFSFDGENGGVFTNAFIAGIHDRSAAPTDGRVTASQLLSYVRQVTGAYCASAKDDCTRGFTPVLTAPKQYLASVIVPYLPTQSPPTAPTAPQQVASETSSDQQGPAPAATPALAPTPATAPEPASKPEPPPPYEVIEGGPALVDLANDVFRHDNDFQLSASILPAERVRLGSSVKFKIDSAETGRLLVLDTAPDGKLRRIFPNAYSNATSHQGEIRADHTLTIPDETYAMEFTATDPGLGTLIVLVAEPGTDFDEIINASPAFEEAEAPGKSLLAVAAQLQSPLLDPDPAVPNRARRWAFVTVPYYVGE